MFLKLKLKKLRCIIDTLHMLVDEVIFIADKNSLHTRVMDSGHRAMIDFELPESAFMEYECNSEVKLGIDPEDMSRALKRDEEDIELSFDSEKRILNITFEKTTQSIDLLDLSFEELNLPKISFDSLIMMETKRLKKLLDTLKAYGNYITLIQWNEGLSLSSETEFESVTIELKNRIRNFLDFSVTDRSKATYDLYYLKFVSHLSPISDTVAIQFSTNNPIKLDFNIIGGGRLTYWLAPRIEV